MQSSDKYGGTRNMGCLIALILLSLVFWIAYPVLIARELTLKRNNFICFEDKGGTSLAMVKNGKIGKVIEANDGEWIKLTERLYKVRESWDNIYLYKYDVVPKKSLTIQKQKKSGMERYINRV